jgi:hypothetical protein
MFCRNGSQCVFLSEHESVDEQFRCVCAEGYAGDRCEQVQPTIVVSFDNRVHDAASLFFHFIRVNENSRPDRVTTFKSIPYGMNRVTTHRTSPFHLLFVEFERALDAADRCSSIDELFDETITALSLIRRMKYYQLPCRRNASCFYDSVHLCLCQELDGQHFANCFEFDHQMNMNRSGKSSCENGGQCYQDEVKCPTRTICVCPVCFYGALCQLNTHGFSLSLDGILGYQIQSNVPLSKQPTGIVINLIVSALINGILLIITFKNKATRQMGCGLYLSSSSVNVLLAMIFFGLKVFILVASQIGSIGNRAFHSVQCKSLDYLLRFTLTLDHWLTACVAIERAFTSAKQLRFDVKKTKATARQPIALLLLLISISTIQDPLFRQLFDEDRNGVKRIWCIVKYSSAVNTINIASNMIHFTEKYSISNMSSISTSSSDRWS